MNQRNILMDLYPPEWFDEDESSRAVDEFIASVDGYGSDLTECYATLSLLWLSSYLLAIYIKSRVNLDPGSKCDMRIKDLVEYIIANSTDGPGEDFSQDC